VRVGHGFDAHRLGGDPPMVLGGVVVDGDRGVVATSDGDVAVHAVIDALLGACAQGDLGTHFPSSDPAMTGIDSMELLSRAARLIEDRAHLIHNVDVTVVSPVDSGRTASRRHARSAPA